MVRMRTYRHGRKVIRVESRSWFVTLCWALLVGASFGQTFEIGNPNHPTASAQSNSTANASPQEQTGSGLGWGSSVEVARQARAARDALQKGDYAAATAFAEQAAKSAPQEVDLWFLLGYAARLSGRYAVSLDAYQHGLKSRPNSLEGLAGLAQTYARMGRDNEARNLLLKVLAASPGDANILQMTGEMFLNSDPQRALELLRRADTRQPSARAELLIARAYQRLNQPDQAKEFLARAKEHAPHDPEVLRAAAGQYRDAGQYDLAIATLRALPSKTPDMLAELAYTYQLAGQKQQAADVYAQAAREAKGNIGFLLSAAQALVSLGQMEAARGFLDKAREINGDNYRLHEILGHMAETEDRLADAVREYQFALSHLPASVPEGPLYSIQLRLNLYELYQQDSDPKGAQQQLDLATTEMRGVRPTAQAKPEYLRLRAAIEATSGDLAAADRDLQAALSLAPSDVNSILNYATVLWKLGQKEAARKMFLRALNLDPHDRQALLSLGYLARDGGDLKSAHSYFARAVSLYPRNYSPYQALGDLYTSEKDFPAAQSNYEAAYQRMAGSASIIAGGANAALEMHNLDLAKQWLERATGAVNDTPQVMRERERYLTLTGAYLQAANLGYQVIARLPRDPQAPIYLAYDLYYLGRYQEASALLTKYKPIFPTNKDLALISGYLHVHDGQYREALGDFTQALHSDPKMATGYVNRGFVLNQLLQPSDAAKDFQMAIELSPNYGEAHLGLAYSYLQLRRPEPALGELDTAEKLLGQNRVWHLARAEAFRQEQKLAPAATEYRAALQEQPNDLTTQMALADTLYQMHQYQESLDSLNAALKLSPAQAAIYARMAQAHARLGQRPEALRSVQSAEQHGGGQPDILMSTGDALLVLGEQEAAMQRFSGALDAAEADRTAIRLAIAQVFVRENRWDDATRQIALSFAEPRIGEAPAATADNFVQAGNLLLAMNEFSLSRSYFEKARQAGASERVVAIGLANSYLAEGDTQKAHAELASMGDPSQYRDDYAYTLAWANLYRQRQDTVHALSAFARASSLAGQDDQTNLQSTQYELAGEEGRQITPQISFFSNASLQTQLEDINVYTLDAKLLGVTNPALLPAPRHSLQSLGEAHYRVHLHGLPTIAGFVGESRASGTLSFPSTGVIQDRATYDTMFNGGISQPLRLGSNTLTFDTGLQFTVRRDSVSPLNMNQNLFRQFLYLSTSSFANWVSVRGSAARETGPFTKQNLKSRELAAGLEFTVGRPWGRTALLSGYSVRDLLFRPLIREYFTTSTYVGLQHQFGNRLTVAGLAEYLRSWEVYNNSFAIAQAIRPRLRLEYRASPRWQVQGSFALSRGEGFHAYDNVQNEFLISYLRPVRGKVSDNTGETPIDYPSRFSFGVQQQTFYNFTGSGKTMLLPILRFTLY